MEWRLAPVRVAAATRTGGATRLVVSVFPAPSLPPGQPHRSGGAVVTTVGTKAGAR